MQRINTGQTLCSSTLLDIFIQQNAYPKFRVNVKLGGINSIAESGIMDYITDPANPAIVIGKSN